MRILAVLCGLTIVWLGVVYALYRRMTERRRREQGGLEPLPDLLTSFRQWFQRLANLSASSARSVSSSVSDIAMPDLDLLTGEWSPAEAEPPPQLDRADLEAVFELPPAPESVAASEPLDAPERVAEFEPLALPAALHEERLSVGTLSEDEDDMPAPPDSIELLRVWRDLSDGSLIIEIGGQRFTSLADLQGANLDRRFVNVVRDLTTLLRAAQSAPPAPAAPTPPAQPAVRAASAKAESAGAPAAPAAPKPAGLNDDMPSLSAGTMFRQMGRVAMGHKPPPLEEMPMLSIPDQIEAVLQHHLAALPGYTGRSIHVRPSPFGGVRIEVDGQYFDGVDEVADDEVRAMIQDVVREWEAGQ